MRAQHRSLMAGTRVAAVAALLVGLAACGSATDVGDYNQRYSVQADLRTFRAEIPMPQVNADGGGASIAMVPGFMEEFDRRARSPMRVQMPVNMSPRDQQATDMFLEWLDDRGVRTIVVPGQVTGPAPDDGSLGLSYDAYVAVVPNCGDWSGHTGLNPRNAPHSNFGCAVNRNVGLMLSDPGDLVDPRSLGSVDGARQALVVTKYRAGAATDAAIPRSESGSLTGIGE
ncbi:CpaD family pilus assembly protein [Roseospira navarrensis]|uniref:Pilus assembly protein CpaD n=1 Tax=Roseospira navarrensis TaxID=140058 RepID=A0A7X1ZEC5_9PROT|nr:CpaD family pilus assembly lipoprotein [Roseospira navarrensis]MQX36031.1 hypothetical protein [Roseospira navarrensis]